MCSCNIEPPDGYDEMDADNPDNYWPPMSEADTEAMYTAMYADHLRDLARHAGPTAKDWTDDQTRQFLRDLASSPAECAYIPIEEED